MTSDNAKNSTKEFDFVKDETRGHEVITSSNSNQGSPERRTDVETNQKSVISSDKGNRQNAATVNVTITDQDKPIVILFGPSQCGKTMTLVRLTRYLSSKNYLFKPDQAFKDSTDEEYEELCENFNAAVSSDEAADGTKYIDFMLLRVNQKRGGRTFCQFLESPGEYLFDPDDKGADFPAYFNTICSAPNRKIWIFFLEPTLSNSDKSEYVRKITEDISFGRDDRFIFLVNKIDKPVTKHLILTNESIDEQGLRTYVDQTFNGLTSCQKFIKEKIFKTEELFKIVGFQTGTYKIGKDKDGNIFKTFQAGNNSHPERLWNAIDGAVNGDW